MKAWRLLLAALAVAGCAEDRETFPVSGLVRFDDGSSVNVGLIEFIPVEGGPSARASIEPGGSYRLMTHAPDDGAMPGEYIVLVSQPQLLMGLMRPAPEGHNDEHHAGVTIGAGVAPPRYAQRDKSPLRATVKRDENQIDFVLDAAPGAAR